MHHEAPWGKLDRQSGRSHHLAHHCADVAACFLALMGIPVFRSRLESAADRRLDEADVDRLGVLIFLHDIGKLHPGFQAKGWPAGRWPWPVCGHLQQGLDIFQHLEPAAEALHVAALESWGVELSLFRAVLAHHGRPIANDPGNGGALIRHHWRPVGGYDPQAAAVEIGALLPLWFPIAFGPVARQLPQLAAFEHALAGFVALADWIGSDQARFNMQAELDPTYMARAKRQATTVISQYGLDAVAQRAVIMGPVTFRNVSGHEAPNLQQSLVGTTDLDARLVILEAETGSGKTEAALWRYAQLFEAGKVDGLYFAVPTRAAAVQLHGRVCAASKRIFGQACPQPVLAVPGYIRAGDTDGTPLPHWTVRWDDERDADEGTLAARWAAESSKRFLAAQIAVGTVDQAMLGALMVKHAHLRSSSLSRSLLVIDEVHASDRFMTVIQKRLLDGHREIGGYAMLMSATLGSSARSQWLGQLQPGLDDAVTTPYPAVWTEKGKAPRWTDGVSARTKHVAMALCSTMEPGEFARGALDASRGGARVLIIRNTVDAAVKTLQAVEALAAPADTALMFNINGVVTLHHSRFAPEDRKRLDQAAEEALKPASDRPVGGKIVIGTQTLEQSLDIDADLLLTDLCPIDVLLQRIGRLHRHGLPRPAGFEQPRCVVAIPDGGLEQLLKPAFQNGLGAWRTKEGTVEGIYRDLAILELTRRQIEDASVWSIPAMNRQLVERATHPDAVAALHVELGTAWARYHSDIIAGELAQTTIARLYTLDRTKRFDDLAFPSDEERIRTRLGAEGARIVFAGPLPVGPLGNPVSEIVLPAHWSHGLPVDQAPVVVAHSDGSFTFAVGNKSFAVSRYGVQRAKGPNEPAEGAADPG